MIGYPCFVDVCRYDGEGDPNSQENYRVELIIEGTILGLEIERAKLGLSYGISKERANELASRIASRLGVEARLEK